MVNALTGNASLIQQVVASSSPQPAATAASADTASSTVNRATAPDTATISAAGQQAYKASQDGDQDGS
jgi:hypothetical protein